MQFFRVKNFEEYQGEKRKRVNGTLWTGPWFKLYSTILDNFEIAQLTNEQKWFFIGFLALANENGNVIRADEKWLQHRLRTTSPIDLNVFIYPDDPEADFIELIEDQESEEAAKEFVRLEKLKGNMGGLRAVIKKPKKGK